MDVRQKVLFISYDGLTDPLGQSQILPYLIGLSSTYDITILSCEKKDRYLKLKENIQRICNTHGISWEYVFFKSKPPVIAKFIDLFQLKRKAIDLYKKNKFKIIHCRSYISIEIGLLLKKRFGARVLFDMRGFWVDERVEGGLWNINNPFYKFAYKYYKGKEAFFIRNSDHIISLTETGKKEIQTWKSYKTSTPITVIPCMVDFKVFSSNGLTKAEAKTRLGFKETEFVVSYLGSLGTWYLMEEMFDFYKEIKNHYPDAKFLMITPDKPEEILRNAMSRGLNPNDFKIMFAPRQEVPEKIMASDVSLVFIKNCYSKKASSPTKLGELMAMGVPVICNKGVGDVDEIIANSRGGLILQNFDILSYQETIRDFPGILRLSGSDIVNSIRPYYDLEKGISSYLMVYKKLLEN